MLLGVEGGQRGVDVVEAVGEREVLDLEGAEAILGQDEDGAGRAGGERGLADAGDAMDQDPRRLQRRAAVQGGERDGHAVSFVRLGWDRSGGESLLDWRQRSCARGGDAARLDGEVTEVERPMPALHQVNTAVLG